MTETQIEVFANCAGLLTRMVFSARAEAAYKDARQPDPVVALVTDAPEMLVGYAVAMVAEDPQAHLPTRSAKVPPHRFGQARRSAVRLVGLTPHLFGFGLAAPQPARSASSKD